MYLFNRFKDNLLDKPSMIGRYCPVCGDYATDAHHVIQKGIGGVKPETEKRIPKLKLCRSCHSKVHAKLLHFQWSDRWLWLETGQPMSDDKAWELYSGHYSPCKYVDFM